MESVLNYMTVGNVLDLQERGCLNGDDDYYYVLGTRTSILANIKDNLFFEVKKEEK